MAAAFTGVFKRAFGIAGLSFGVNSSVDSSLATPWDETVAAAKSGQLTTRTNATTGTLTMAGGHGFQTGDRLDIYWTEAGVAGRRYGAAVGTVSTNSVPISGGTGDNLPTNLTAVTAMVPTALPVVVTGDNAVSVAVNCPVGGTVVFANSGNSTIFAFLATAANASYVWISGQGTNPLAGGSVAKVFLSHANTGASSDLSGCVQFNP